MSLFRTLRTCLISESVSQMVIAHQSTHEMCVHTHPHERLTQIHAHTQTHAHTHARTHAHIVKIPSLFFSDIFILLFHSPHLSYCVCISMLIISWQPTRRIYLSSIPLPLASFLRSVRPPPLRCSLYFPYSLPSEQTFRRPPHSLSFRLIAVWQAAKITAPVFLIRAEERESAAVRSSLLSHQSA